MNCSYFRSCSKISDGIPSCSQFTFVCLTYFENIEWRLSLSSGIGIAIAQCFRCYFFGRYIVVGNISTDTRFVHLFSEHCIIVTCEHSRNSPSIPFSTVRWMKIKSQEHSINGKAQIGCVYWSKNKSTKINKSIE